MLLERLHASEGGAVALLCLAALLIIFMTALAMYDGQESAREKMNVQIGSDTAALSHAAIKARGMNMVAYSNVTKRILYGYNMIYISALMALIEATGYYLYEAGEEAASAIKNAITVVGIPAALIDAGQAILNAIEAVKGIVQLILELIEFGTVTGNRLYGLPGGDQWRSAIEVASLDLYQEYIVKMTPWWAWGEAVTRGMRNGSTLVGTWPIPGGDVQRIRDKLRFVANIFTGITGVGSGADGIIKTTNNEDELPLEQIPELVNVGPFISSLGVPKWIAHAKLCASTLTSSEFWLMQFFKDHWLPSEGYWDDTSKPSGAMFAPRTLVTLLEIAQLPVGCVVSALTLGHEVLPYDIKARVQSAPWAIIGGDTSPIWLKQTSNVAIGYSRGDGRFSDSGKRQKFGFISNDYVMGADDELFRNDGYWTLSKAELIYEAGLMADLTADATGALNGANSIPGIGSVLNALKNWMNEPNMWAPRWTARMRPMALPRECPDQGDVGEYSTGCAFFDMDAMMHDSLPFMAATAPLALAYGDGGSFPGLDEIQNLEGNFNAAMNFLSGFARDVFFLERAADGFTIDRQIDAWEK